MARRVMGRYYKVEDGVYATLRGFAASTGFKGCKMVHLDILEGTDHLFHAENLPPTLTDIREGKNSVGAFLSGRVIAEISELPKTIQDRYRLAGYDFIILCWKKWSDFRCPKDEIHDGEW